MIVLEQVSSLVNQTDSPAPKLKSLDESEFNMLKFKQTDQ